MYSYTKKVALSFNEAKEKTLEALKLQGFGILTKIDVKANLNKKLDVDFDNYVILGVCNPPFALKALQAEYEIGLMLPCNVIVYEKNGEIYVSAINPESAMQAVNNPGLAGIAHEIKLKLENAVNGVGV